MDISLAWETVKGWINDFFIMLPNIGVALIAFIAIAFAGKLIKKAIIRMTENNGRSKNVGIVVGRLAHGGIVILGIFVALMIVVPSVNAGQLVGALGIGSIAIGFAFKDILQNFLAGILILLQQPFKIGDVIVVGSYDGTVENIETRATTIKTFDSRRVVIPNAKMFTESVTVNTAYDKRRMDFDFGIGYGDDITKAKAIILDVMETHEGVLSDPAPDVMTVGLADSSVTLKARWWCAIPQTNLLTVRDDIITTVKNRFDQEGIDIPFPIRTLNVSNGSLPVQTKTS